MVVLLLIGLIVQNVVRSMMVVCSWNDCCYNCGKSVHIMKDCTMLKVQGREGKQAPHSSSNPDAPKTTASMLFNPKMTRRAL